MSKSLRELLVEHNVLVPTDNAFQRRARLLQALWREEQELPVGKSRGRDPLGSRIALAAAEESLLNYMTETIRGVVRREVLDTKRSKGKLYAKPRIFDDMLSSQPFCFNLFAELQQDLGLATRAFHNLSDRIDEVTAIWFEHSPGRGAEIYLGDSSAFDVFVEYAGPKGVKGFVGIEVKYHEALGDPPASHKKRYDEVAMKMGCFDVASLGSLKDKPLQQIWRDHLLVGALRLDGTQRYGDAFFAFAYPRGNECCADAIASYRKCLSDTKSFVSWTLEEIVQAVKSAGGGSWVDAVAQRYLAFEKVDALLAR